MNEKFDGRARRDEKYLKSRKIWMKMSGKIDGKTRRDMKN